ncbi:MAG: guanylate cyclase [Saprospiraceae bacterium]|nr:MAG: guanylate cyclase [Saprospiraceae bacterium]
MKNLIPHFIQEKYKEGTKKGQFKAYTLFVDLSGFTPLTESLMRAGSRGAEQLSIILNEVFGPLVSLMYARGGFIPYFAGDAFTAVIRTDDTDIEVEDVIYTALMAREMFSRRAFRFGNFTISVKFGLSYGLVEWGIVGNKDQQSFYFRGAAIDDCATCQTYAKGQEIVVDNHIREKLLKEVFPLESIGNNCYKLGEVKKIKDRPITPQVLPPLNKNIVKQFLPEPVVEYKGEGEFRTVIAVFLAFEGINSHTQMNDFATEILDKINDFSGYFKEIDFGDKGAVMVCFFGAPVSFENNIARALEFVLALTDVLAPLQKSIGLKIKGGITVGTAYTGYVGGEERCQYACVGNRVNLGARLMTYANWGEVLADEGIQKSRYFKFSHKGDIKYKGIKGNVPTFKLLGRDFENRPTFQGLLVERDDEINRLLAFTQPIFENKFAGIAYIYGEAGVGKSRLTFELRKSLLSNHNQIQWHICQTDQILRKPFNSFVYFLKNYFGQASGSSFTDTEDHFEMRFRLLQDELEGIDHPSVDQVSRELIRTKSILKALVGIVTPNSLWDQLDARGRYQNTMAAIINLIIAESLTSPVILELEDVHWIDDNSTELLIEFARQMNRFPILLLITSRYDDEGAKPVIIPEPILSSYNLPTMEINLAALQPETVRSFAETTLKGKISNEFFDLLLRTTNSNPFYLEQVLEYFMENNLLDKNDGQWTIQDQNVKLSNSINAILTARIDRLSTLVRETVKAAAVIGREFEIPILSEVMKNQEEFLRENGNNDTGALLKEQVKSAEQGQIWLAMNELRYIFRNSLLREAVYGMQLRTRLQQLHQMIAESMERVYKDTIEQRYFDLAFHYEQAGVFDKTCEYLRKAADHARKNYQNQQALDYYERLLKKLGRPNDAVDEINTYLKKGKVQELIGKWEECEETFDRALQLAKKSRDVLMLGKTNNSMGHLLMLKGEYSRAMSFLQAAAGLFESVEDEMGIARVSGDIGNLYFRQGKYDEAKSYFEKSIDLGYTRSGAVDSAQIVANLGLTHMNQGNYDEGIQVQKVQLDIAKLRNDKQGMATLYTNIGIVYFEKGDYDAALESYQKGLALSEELGNKLLKSIAIGCIGSVYERKGNYEQAMKHFKEDLELCEELGDKQGTAIALGLIGELLSIEGKFFKAIEYLQKNLMLCEELGYQKGIAKAVNTLGDIFFFTQQYERSLEYYNRAIDVTRKINNRLVLGFSLVEKGTVLLSMEQIQEAKEVSVEAVKIAEELGNPDLIFEAHLLVGKIQVAEGEKDRTETELLALLETSLTSDQEAAVYFELFHNNPDKKEYQVQAMALYRILYEETPRFSYKDKIQELEKS